MASSLLKGILTGFLALCLFLPVRELGAQPPATITIQGVAQNSAGGALTGARNYRVRFFDALTVGSQLGSDLTGAVTLSSAGRFSFEITPPTEILSAAGVWYELAVDSDATPNGIDANDVFPDRVKVTSVPFARLAADSKSLDGTTASAYATDSELSTGLATKAEAIHTHNASDIIGTLTDSQIPATIARDSEILSTVLAGDGSGSTLDADLLDGLEGSAYATDAEVSSAVSGLVSNPSAPAAPTELRMLPSLRGAPFRRLVWNIAGFGGMANFIVYESSAPITDGNKTSAFKRYVSTTEVEISVTGNAGVRNFRVAALNFAGVEGALSNEFSLDTTLRVAYIADQTTDGVSEVWSSKADGTGNAKVNAPFLTVSDAFELKFSPDGSRIAYLADQDTDEVLELYVAPASGGGASTKVNPPLVANGNVSFGSFVFSPDGTRIAYLADQDTDEVFELYVAPASGGGSATKVNPPLVAGGDVFSGFAFSPDGTRIAYLANQDTFSVSELYVAPASGGGTAIKVNPSLVANGDVFSGFVFSPDGTRIAYLADQDTDFINELYVAPASGGGTSTKVNPALVANGDVFSGFVFSPDGTRIAYLADQTTDEVFELYVAPASGGGSATKVNPALVANGDVFSGFAFSPDGTRIAYRADQDTDAVIELYVAPASGGGTSTKVNPALVANGAVQFSFAFSPDGTRIAYLADQDTDNVFELYVAPASGGGASTKVNPPLVANGGVSAFSLSPFGHTP